MAFVVIPAQLRLCKNMPSELPGFLYAVNTYFARILIVVRTEQSRGYASLDN